MIRCSVRLRRGGGGGVDGAISDTEPDSDGSDSEPDSDESDSEPDSDEEESFRLAKNNFDLAFLPSRV